MILMVTIFLSVWCSIYEINLHWWNNLYWQAIGAAFRAMNPESISKCWDTRRLLHIGWLQKHKMRYLLVLKFFVHCHRAVAHILGLVKKESSWKNSNESRHLRHDLCSILRGPVLNLKHNCQDMLSSHATSGKN